MGFSGAGFSVVGLPGAGLFVFVVLLPSLGLAGASVFGAAWLGMALVAAGGAGF